MFLVKDNVTERVEQIKSYIKIEPPIAIILAALHFEWTVKRAIIALGETPNLDLQKEKTSGLEDYKGLWKKEISTPAKTPRLPEVVKQWKDLDKAFKTKNYLVHGMATSCTPTHASKIVSTILDATNDVIIFCKENGYDVNSKPPIKKKITSIL